MDTEDRQSDRRKRDVAILAILLVLAAYLFVAIGVRVVSGEDARYVLEAN